MVHRAIILMNSILQKGSLHRILSLRELVTGKKFRCPTIRIGQWIQGIVGGTNDTDKERLIDTLYLGRADNGSGHIVFKLDMKAVVSVNRVVLIPTPTTIIVRINEIGWSEKQPEGVQFTDKDGKVAINDLYLNLDDDDYDDSNASDESFFNNQEHQEKHNKEKETRFDNLATDKAQQTQFQLPFQLHQAATLLVDDLSKLRSVKVRSMKGKKKKEILQKHDDNGGNNDDWDNNDVNVNTRKSGVGYKVDDDDESTEVDEWVHVCLKKLNAIMEDTVKFDGPYWTNGRIGSKTELYMLSAITMYNNIDGLHGLRSTPQYGFNRGMEEFEQAGYDATVAELSDNLIDMDAVEMLDKSCITSDVVMNALSYLMFLKRKRTDVVKARGCVEGRPQQEFISKEESSSPTVSTYALFVSCAMDAIEGRQVVTCDIPRAFLQANCPDNNDCYLKFEGLMVDMICDIDPAYKKFVLINKETGKKKLYGKLTKAVYGTLLGAIFFYQKLSGQLYKWGYEQNYTPCVLLIAFRVWFSVEGHQKGFYIGEVITWSIFHLSRPPWGCVYVLT